MKFRFVFHVIFLFLGSVFTGCNPGTPFGPAAADENAIIETRTSPLTIFVTYTNNTTATYSGTTFIAEDDTEGFRIVVTSGNNQQTLTGVRKMDIDGTNEFSVSGSSGNYTDKTKLTAIKSSNGIRTTLNPGNIIFTTTTFIVEDEIEGF